MKQTLKDALLPKSRGIYGETPPPPLSKADELLLQTQPEHATVALLQKVSLICDQILQTSLRSNHTSEKITDTIHKTLSRLVGTTEAIIMAAYRTSPEKDISLDIERRTAIHDAKKKLLAFLPDVEDSESFHRRKFAQFYKMIEETKAADGPDICMVHHPAVLGDSWDELTKNLDLLAEAELHLVIIPPSKRNQ